jgi:hypothetical protein
MRRSRSAYESDSPALRALVYAVGRPIHHRQCVAAHPTLAGAGDPSLVRRRLRRRTIGCTHRSAAAYVLRVPEGSLVAWVQGAPTGKTTSQIANIIPQLVRRCSCCRVGRVPPSAHTDYYECKCATNAELILSRACGGYWLHKGSLSVRVGRTASQQCAQWATT